MDESSISRDLMAKEPIHRSEFFSQGGSPDSVNACRFCGADDYNGPKIIPGGMTLSIVHSPTCIWARACRDVWPVLS